MAKKIVNGKEVELTDKEEQELIAMSLLWESKAADRELEKIYELRRSSYPAFGDQLDALLKQFNYMQMTIARQDITFEDKVARCCNCVTDLDDIINQWLSVKARFPKP